MKDSQFQYRIAVILRLIGIVCLLYLATDFDWRLGLFGFALLMLYMANNIFEFAEETAEKEKEDTET